MTRYSITASQIVPADIDRVWAFFSTPANLGRITPPAMDFRMTAPPTALAEGTLIDYRIRPLLGIPVSWRTRIEAWEPPYRFRDIQLKGPYRSWVHTHTFTPVPGGTLVEDHVEYELPLGPLGRLANRLMVRLQLENIFRYRRSAIEAIFRPVRADAATSAAPGRVAVVGGTGFVGGAIARELHHRGRQVVVVSARGETARGQLPDEIEIRGADVRSGVGLVETLADVDEVVIALAFPGSPMEQPSKGRTFMDVDAGGTERVMAAAAAAGVRRAVYISGAGAAPDAKRHWFRAKWRAEEAVRGSGLTWTIIRPTWIYGPGDISLNRFLGFARVLPVVPMTSLGSQPLAPVFIDDAARLAADALEADAAANQVFELGGPEVMSMRQVIARSLRVAGIRRPILPAPSLLVWLAAWPLRYLPGPLLTPDAVHFINQPAVVDLEPLLAAMPRRLTPLEEGLASYLAPADERPVTRAGERAVEVSS